MKKVHKNGKNRKNEKMMKKSIRKIDEKMMKKYFADIYLNCKIIIRRLCKL